MSYEEPNKIYTFINFGAVNKHDLLHISRLKQQPNICLTVSRSQQRLAYCFLGIHTPYVTSNKDLKIHASTVESLQICTW
jgi:hypothetical protein